jgi:8-oxo-dGTP pyrophosphatase MutT (NUDIX family)
MISRENLVTSELCEFKVFPSVQIIFIRQNQPEPEVFLVHRVTDSFHHQWCFPGGKIDPGETKIQAACREAAEETGANLKPENLLFFRTTESQTCRQINNKLTSCRYPIDIFIVNADNLSLFNASPQEHDMACWFTFKQALQTHQNAIETVPQTNQIITPDKIPHALAPKTLEALKLIFNQN